MNGTPSWVMNKVERMIVGAVLAGSRFSSWTRFPSYTAALELVVPKSRPTRIGSLLYRSRVAAYHLVTPSPLHPFTLSPCHRVIEHDKRAAGLSTATLR